MSKRLFRVTDYDSLKHAKSRDPKSWIKLRKSILMRTEFETLPDRTKFHLIGIWMLAGDENNQIEYSSKWIERRIGATGKIDLKSLVEAGFIEVIGAESEEIKPHSRTSSILEDVTPVLPDETPAQELETEVIFKKDAAPSDTKPVTTDEPLSGRPESIEAVGNYLYALGFPFKSATSERYHAMYNAWLEMGITYENLLDLSMDTKKERKLLSPKILDRPISDRMALKLLESSEGLDNHPEYEEGSDPLVEGQF